VTPYYDVKKYVEPTEYVTPMVVPFLHTSPYHNEKKNRRKIPGEMTARDALKDSKEGWQREWDPFW